jgi:hypothetical protein
MRARIYGAIVARPISFPDEMEICIVPLSKNDGTTLGVSCIMDERQSWDWICNQYPLTQEEEERIKGGEAIEVFRGTVETGFPDGTKFPEGSDVEIVEP